MSATPNNSSREGELEVAATNVLRTLYERYDAFRGIYTNPFLDKPIKLQDPCPTCRTSFEGLSNSIKTATIWELHKHGLQQRLEELQKIPHHLLHNHDVLAWYEERKASIQTELREIAPHENT